MKTIKIFGERYNIVPDNGKWEENCPKCDLNNLCASFTFALGKQLCDTRDGCTGYYHFEKLK